MTECASFTSEVILRRPHVIAQKTVGARLPRISSLPRSPPVRNGSTRSARWAEPTVDRSRNWTMKGYRREPCSINAGRGICSIVQDLEGLGCPERADGGLLEHVSGISGAPGGLSLFATRCGSFRSGGAGRPIKSGFVETAAVRHLFLQRWSVRKDRGPRFSGFRNNNKPKKK